MSILALGGFGAITAAAANEPVAAPRRAEESRQSRESRPRFVFPEHWGSPPRIQTRDLVPLPGGYGRGSSTLAEWIRRHIAEDGDALVHPRLANGDGSIRIDGELKQWHKITLSLSGPFAHERDNRPNPFTDYRFTVRFRHESGSPDYLVPGYFAADGVAAQSSAQAGTVWRAHLTPDKPGRWTYAVSFRRGKHAALSLEAAGEPLDPFDGLSGTFLVAPTDKTGRDFRAHGRLEYVGRHHLRFAGSGRYFLKAGPDSPETLLAYADFDGTRATKKNVPLHHYRPHIRDWRPGDPTWKGDRGKGLIGALNYLADKGCNSISFLPYNAGGDGDNVWPFVERNDKLHYDCSKLDQWQIVFDHAMRRGLHLHFKLQETEMDDNRRGKEGGGRPVPTALDGGKLGVERKLYCRELAARFAYQLAMLWNIGEENTQSPEEQNAMIDYLLAVDPYDHHVVVHTFPNAQDKVYSALLGDRSRLTGASLQNPWNVAHQRTLKWIRESARAGRPWVVCNDEQNPATYGVPCDPGYQGHSGRAEPTTGPYDLHDIRKHCLWGVLTAGGGGVEYYFGYGLPQNDLLCEDFRSRDRSWDYCRIAIEFFYENGIPFWQMSNADELVGNPDHSKDRYCLARRGEVYVIYLPRGGTTRLDLTGVSGAFAVRWFDPRRGGDLQPGTVATVRGGAIVDIGRPPRELQEDWVALLRKARD